MVETPFPWLHHGPFDLDCLDKCAEVFLWFQRPVSRKERKRIEEGCPAPVADFYAWGDQWAYFGSPGDTYDSLIILSYAGLPADADEKAVMAVFNDRGAPARGLAAFEAELEAWVRKVHDIVPIAFFYGPGGTDEDEWGRWSRGAVRDLWNRVQAVPETPEEQDDDDEGPSRFLGYIRNLSAGLLAQYGDPAEVLDDLYARDGIRGPLHRLSYEESRLHTNGSLAAKVLARSKDPGALLRSWPPYTQLAYLASYAALDRKDLLTYGDPTAALAALVEALPAERRAAGAPLLAFIADAWVHNTPAFSKPLKKNAKLATAILEVACPRPEATAEMFVNASGYAEMAKDPRRMLVLAETGLLRFPGDPLLWNNAIAAASALGENTLAAELAERMRQAPVVVSAQVLANETFALVQTGDVAGARARIEAHLRAGGEQSRELIANALYCWINTAEPADPALLEPILERVAGDTTLLENAAIYLNNLGRWRDVLDRVDPDGEEMSPTLWDCYTWAGVLAADAEVARDVLDAFTADHGRRKPSADTAENLALLHLRVDEEQAAVRRLRDAIAAGKEPAALRTLPEWAPWLDRSGIKRLLS